MARRKGTSETGWRCVACAIFLVSFVFLGEITKGPADELVASSVLSLAAAAYVVGMFLLGRQGGRMGRLLRDSLALGGAFFLLVNYSPVAEYLAMPLLVRPDVDRADVIVILGGGLYPNSSLMPASLERTLYGMELYRRGLAPRVIFSGGIAGEATRPEGEVMAEFARRWAVPADAIVVEATSRTTYEEAVETAKVLRELGLRQALLVTDPTHMYRSQLAFQRQGVQVLPAPVRTREALRNSAGGRLRLFYESLHEYGGLVYYKIRGRI